MSTSENKIETIDPVIRDVVQTLEDYRSQHPEERTASIAMERILSHSGTYRVRVKI